MKNNIFFDALTHSLRRFQLYLAWIDVQTSADIENCERLALIEQKWLQNEYKSTVQQVSHMTVECDADHTGARCGVCRTNINHRGTYICRGRY